MNLRVLWAILVKELYTHFHSPLVFALGGVYLALSGFFFSLTLFHSKVPSLGAFFHNTSILFIFLIPVLSMRSFAGERERGTFEFLMTLPVRTGEVVLGKSLALVAVTLLLLLPTLSYVLVLFLHGRPDIGAIISGYIGILLLSAGFVSVGLFTSSLVSSQILSAVVALGILLAFWFSDALATYLTKPYSQVALSLSLSDHLSPFFRGILDLRGTIFFLTLPILFLFAASLVLTPQRGRYITLCLLLTLSLLANYAGWKFSWRVDLTNLKLYSLSDQTQKVLDYLPEEVEILLFYLPVDSLSLSVAELLRQYDLTSDKITFSSIDMEANPSVAKAYGVKYSRTVVFKTGSRVLASYGTTEEDLTNVLLRVTRQEKKIVCFTGGHGELDIDSLETHDHIEGDPGHSHSHGGRKVLIFERHGMGNAKRALSTINYEARKVYLMSGNSALAGCDILVIPGPRSPFLDREVQLVADYLEHGGGVFAMIDPYADTNLKELFRSWGIIVNDDIIFDSGNHFWNDRRAPAVGRYPKHPITRDLPLTFFPGARSLQRTNPIPEGVRVTPLLKTTDRSYTEGREATKELGSRTLMLLSQREKGAILLVVGDSDFATNSYFYYLGNGTLFLNAISWLTDAHELLSIPPRENVIPMISLTNRQMEAIFNFTVIMLPSAFLLTGAALWWRQR